MLHHQRRLFAIYGVISRLTKRIDKLNIMKAKIIQIGKVINRNPVNWSFESYTLIPALSISGKGILYYGYTVEELELIAQAKF